MKFRNKAIKQYSTIYDTIEAAAKYYDRHAERLERRADRAAEGSKDKMQLIGAAKFNRGRAAAMREVIEFIEEYNG